jgi:hypothetical protein
MSSVRSAVPSILELSNIFLQQMPVPPNPEILNYNKDCTVVLFLTLASVNGRHLFPPATSQS